MKRTGNSSPAVDRKFFNPITARAPAPACEQIQIDYNPHVVSYGKPVVPTLEFSPSGCRTLDYPRFRIDSSEGGEFKISETGMISKHDHREGWVKVKATIKTDTPLGIADDVVSLWGQATPECKSLRWVHRPETAHLGEPAVAMVDFDPPDCHATSRDVVWTSRNLTAIHPDILTFSHGASVLKEFWGRQLGRAQITAKTWDGLLESDPVEVSVVNDGPACTGMFLQYHSRELRDGGTWEDVGPNGLVPRVGYIPGSCRKPEGQPKFEPIYAQPVTITNSTTGALHGNGSGTATIRITHGRIHGDDQIKVISRPECNELTLSIGHTRIPVGTSTHAVSGVRNAKGVYDPAEARSCYVPRSDGGVSTGAGITGPEHPRHYTSSNTDIATVDDKGNIRALRADDAVITVSAPKHPNLKPASREMQVVD